MVILFITILFSSLHPLISKSKITLPTALIHFNTQLYPNPSATRKGWYDLGGGLGNDFILTPTQQLKLSADYLYQSRTSYALHHYFINISWNQPYLGWSFQYDLTQHSSYQHTLNNRLTLKTLPILPFNFSYENQISWSPYLTLSHGLGIEVFPEPNDRHQTIGLYLEKSFINWNFIVTFQFWLQDRLINYFTTQDNSKIPKWIIKLSYQLTPHQVALTFSYVGKIITQNHFSYQPRAGTTLYLDVGYRFAPKKKQSNKNPNKNTIQNFKSWLLTQTQTKTKNKLELLLKTHQTLLFKDKVDLWLTAFIVHREKIHQVRDNYFFQDLQKIGLSDTHLNSYYYHILFEYFKKEIP